MKNFFIITLIFLMLVLGCSSDKKSSKDSSLFSSDETVAASKIIQEANEELKKTKVIYKTNKNRLEDLRKAMAEKNIEKVKTILNDLVLEINNGLISGDEAYKKIEKAEEMNINSTYKEYLELKRDSLRKHLDAFKLSHQFFQRFRDSVGGKDPKIVDQAQADLTTQLSEFQKLIDEARDLSQQANDLYTESMNKK